jgi:DNA topoisomerase-1
MKDYIIRKIKSKRGKKFTHEYTNKRGNLLNKSEYEPLLQNLYIAPAYDNVKINKHKKDKVLAIGTDDRGRKQHTYNPEYV